jgi:hypothetical protein
MAAAILLPDDFTSEDLRLQAKRSRDGGHARRLLALAEIYDGGARTDAARIGGVGSYAEKLVTGLGKERRRISGGMSQPHIPTRIDTPWKTINHHLAPAG